MPNAKDVVKLLRDGIQLLEEQKKGDAAAQ